MAEPGSPLWHVERLTKALDARALAVRSSECWHSGDHPIPPPPSNTFAAHDGEARRAFTNLARNGVTNFLGPVADMPAAKLLVDGFQFGEGSRANDSDAWTIYQRNHLEADAPMAIEAALRTGQAFLLVWAGPNGKAQITVEDPGQAIVSYQAGSRRIRSAGLKRWVDDDGYTLATLYLPTAIYKYRSAGRVNDYGAGLILPPGVVQNSWVPRTVAGEQWPLPNPLKVVPLVELAVNTGLRARPFGGGLPEFHAQIPNQHKINHTVVNMLVTMEHQAFRQRWVIGWQPPIDKETGEPDRYATLRASAASLMVFKNPEARVGEFSQADFSPFISAIEAWVKVIAANTSTPPYAFLLGDMINVAADALARIEGNFTSKIRRHANGLGEGLLEALQLGLRVEDNKLADDPNAHVIWHDPEERTATEQAQVATTYDALGAPKEAVFSALPGVDQQEARRWMAQKAGDDLLANALASDTNGGAPPAPLVPAR